MSHYCIEGTLWDTLQAAPAAAHVNEGRFFALKTNKGVAAANLLSQTSSTSLAYIIIDFEHDGAGGSYGHGEYFTCILESGRYARHQQE